MSEEALRYICKLFYLWEKYWILLTALSFMVVTLLPRPDGGWRLIALFATLYRLWARCRKCYAMQWEDAKDAVHFISGPCRSSTEAVWRASARAEAGTLQGYAAAAMLLDGVKFYERIPYDILVDEATE